MAGNLTEDEKANLFDYEVPFDSDASNSKNFEGIFGLDRTRDMLKESIVMPFLSQETRSKKIIFLFGAPGSGKTLLLREAARASKATLSVFSAWKFQSRKYSDSASECLQALFKNCRKKMPCILCFEDIEVLERNTYPFITVKSSFINEIKRFLQEDEATTENLVVVVTAQRPWEVDPCLMKLFSTSSSSHVVLPNHKARIGLLKNLCETLTVKNSLTHDDFEMLASKTDGFSGSDLNCLVRGASMEPLRILSKATHFKKVYLRSVVTLDSVPRASIEVEEGNGDSTAMNAVPSSRHLVPGQDPIEFEGESETETHPENLAASNQFSTGDENRVFDEYEEKYVPCNADETDALPMSVFDIPEDKIEIPKVTMEHMVKELSDSRRTITMDELHRLSHFESDYCSC